MTLPMCQALA